MGVYSNLAAQRINEASLEKTFQYTDLLEYAINIQQSDQAMFDAMLEMDFHEAYAAKGLISINEADEKGGVVAAVKKIIGKVIEAFRKLMSVARVFLDKVTNHLAEITGQNKRLAQKYRDLDLTNKTVIDAIGDKEISVTIMDPKYSVDPIKDCWKHFFSLKERFEYLYTSDEEVESVKNDIDAIVDKAKDSLKNGFVKKDLKKALSDNDIEMDKLYKGLVNPYSDQIGNLKSNVNKLIGMCQSIQTNYQKKLKDDKLDDQSRKDCSNITKITSYTISNIYIVMNLEKSIIARSCAVERSVFAKCAAIVERANKKQDKDAKSDNKSAETAEDVNAESSNLELQLGAIDIMNEIFIDNLFA